MRRPLVALNRRTKEVGVVETNPFTYCERPWLLQNSPTRSKAGLVELRGLKKAVLQVVFWADLGDSSSVRYPNRSSATATTVHNT
jgi:hypothetical protein